MNIGRIEKENPKGLRYAEMTLVKMLKETRCWADKMEIMNALYKIRWDAESMKKESDALSSHDATAGQIQTPSTVD